MSAAIPLIAVHYKKSKIGKQIISHRNESSVLDHPEGLVPYSAGGRKRLATCSGVSWIGNHHLVTVNLYGQHLRIYRLEEIKQDNETKYQLKLITQKNDEIEYPDAVMVSDNGKWVAVTHSLLDQKGVTVHESDIEKFEVFTMRERLAAPYTCHGVHFSPDSRFLAFTTLEYPGSVEVYDMLIPGHRVCFLPNNHEHLRPKDICFTSDSKYAAIIYSEIVGIQYVEKNINHRRIAIHRYDAVTGVIEENCLALLQDSNFLVNSFELASFRPGLYSGEYQIFITNQFADKVVEINFNPVDNSLYITGSFGGNLSFPHGIDFSKDGKLLAVTNFGDDQVRIFDLEQEDFKSENIRPHILLCAHSSSQLLFGAERSFIDLAKAFNQLGYKISCLLPQENMEYTNELANYVDAVYHLPYAWHDHRQPYVDHYLTEIETLIKRESIDVLHTNSTVIPDVLLAAKRAGIPSIVHARELLIEDDVLTKGMGIDSAFILSKLGNNADYVIANSKKTMEQFQKGDNIYCLYNAVDINRFDIAPIAKDGILKIGLISSNSIKKGIHDFVEIAVACEDLAIEFLMIGPYNSEIEKIQAKIKNHKTPPRMKFIDYISDPVEAISMVDVVVSLSGVGESFGRTVAEGMAARRPVIVYDRGAMSELVTDQVTGFLIAPGDLKQVLYWIKWLNQNRAEAKEMGERGRQFVQKTFAFDLFQSNLDTIYKTIIK